MSEQQIHTGPSGGRYRIVNGKKRYLKKTKEGGNILVNAYHAIRGTRKDFPPKVRNFIKSKGDVQIRSISSYRTPIVDVLERFLDIISLGGISRAKREFNQDKLFHLYSVLFLSDGSIWKLEKNHVINVEKFKYMGDKHEALPAGIIPVHNLTVRGLFEKMYKQQGGDLFHYSAEKLNCQNFTSNLFRAAGILTPSNEKFINQPSEQIVKSLPGYAQRFMQATTDIAHRGDILLHGKGTCSF